ncbi:MAG: porin family protein, partial [Gammaproteobacteria bacterium]|nr:porin family protein [Gammaproteobacteria bacterium]
SAIGFQIFGGYDLPVKMGNGTLSVEAGYMDTGDMDGNVTLPFFGSVPATASASGLWGNAVYTLPLQDKLDLLLRAGLDIGDDDGVMFGAGLGFDLNAKMQLRGEYVIRDTIDSLQLNFVMRM